MCDIRLRQTGTESEGAMRGDQQGGLVKSLLDGRVREAWDAAHLADHALRIGRIGRHVSADYLHVERGRQAKIKDLCRDITGWEGEAGGRKQFRQLISQNRAVLVD